MRRGLCTGQTGTDEDSLGTGDSRAGRVERLCRWPHREVQTRQALCPRCLGEHGGQGATPVFEMEHMRTLTVYLASVFVPLGCYIRTPQTGWLTDSKHFFLNSRGCEARGQEAKRSSVCENLPLSSQTASCLLAVSPQGGRQGSSLQSLLQGPNPMNEGFTLMT